MLTTTAVALLLAWILAMFSSFTMGGWIHLLPLAAEGGDFLPRGDVPATSRLGPEDVAQSTVQSVTESWSLMKIRLPDTTGYA